MRAITFYTGKIFTGSTKADTITSAGAKLTINAGNDIVTINGGAGNDTILRAHIRAAKETIH